MNKIVLLLVVVTLIGSALARPQFPVNFNPQFPQRPFNRPGGAAAFPGQTLFGGGNAAGLGGGSVQNGQVVGTGTGIANPGPGGFGVALGVGGAVASPVGNFAIGQGESISVGK